MGGVTDNGGRRQVFLSSAMDMVCYGRPALLTPRGYETATVEKIGGESIVENAGSH